MSESNEKTFIEGLVEGGQTAATGAAPTEGDVVRAMDGYEYTECFIWLSLSDELPLALDVAKFRAALDAVTAPYEAFHLATRPPLWTRLACAPSACVTEEPWTARETCERMDPVTPEGGRLWFVTVATEPAAATATPRTRITLHACHALADGRTLGTMFAVVLHAVLAALADDAAATAALLAAAPALRALPALPPPCALCAYGQRDNYDCARLPAELLQGGVPRSWRRMHTLDAVLPRITLPDHYVARYADYALAPWQAYAARCAERPSLQGALIAAETRALRRYCGLAADAAVVAEVMYDTRHTAYATPAMRARAFFCGAGAGFVEVCGRGAWAADIAACTAALRADAARPDTVAMVVQMGAAMDARTGVLRAPEGMPASFRTNVVVTTHIGRYDGTTAPRVGVRLACVENYCVCQYVWTTPTTVHVMYLHPSTVDPAYIQAFHDATAEMFAFVADATTSSSQQEQQQH